MATNDSADLQRFATDEEAATETETATSIGDVECTCDDLNGDLACAHCAIALGKFEREA